MTLPVDDSAALPVVVMLGFSGSRQLRPDCPARLESTTMLSDAEAGPSDPFTDALQQALVERLVTLPSALGLRPAGHFLCGQSQMATEADRLFERACGQLEIALRVVLPEPAERFLDSGNAAGQPDFDDDPRQQAKGLLAGAHVVDIRVVSQAPTCHERCAEADIEIVRSSDILILLLRQDPVAQPDESQFLKVAKRHGKPVLEIRVACVDGPPVLTETRHNWPGEHSPWKEMPALPADLSPELSASVVATPAAVGMPLSADSYLGALKQAGSRQARQLRFLFKGLAVGIIGTHVLATLCAVLAMKVAPDPAWLLSTLLIVELGLLLLGLFSHHLLHHSEAARRWAMARLVAEVARSAGSLAGLTAPLQHLFELPFPSKLQALLRTVNVLHLASSKVAPRGLEELRERYRTRRLHGDNGQLRYYNRAFRQAHRWRVAAQASFYASALLAISATLAKLLVSAYGGHSTMVPLSTDATVGLLGVAAIVLPLFAVAALSLAAAADLDARVQTYEETLRHLKSVDPLIQQAGSSAELRRLVFDTESCLLGETATWASRRSFTSVN